MLKTMWNWQPLFGYFLIVAFVLNGMWLDVPPKLNINNTYVRLDYVLKNDNYSKRNSQDQGGVGWGGIYNTI